MGFDLVSTGGTADTLRLAGLKVKDVSELTGVPAMMGGRVKTLDYHIHAGILADRDNPEHMADAAKYGIEMIDLVVVNLYDFLGTAEDPDVSLPELTESIDIGGHTLVRAAAKNWKHVGVVVNLQDYDRISEELVQRGGWLSSGTKLSLAIEALDAVACYDRSIPDVLRDRAGY
ncbi:MAG: hypothetical protein HY918_05275 [Candidatus Doudnabacteria bacterium]|nr:hypothetical protein [Candidatus Doudnabacteria bacterium]